MKIIITESRVINFIYKEFESMRLRPVKDTCIAGTPCIKLIDKSGEEIFRIDVANDVYFSGEILYLTELFSIDIGFFKTIIKSYLRDVLGYNINRVL